MKFATVTDFECSDWSCHRVATTYNFRTEPAYRDMHKTMAELFTANIYCNIHAGAIKRKKSGRWASHYENENLTLISELGSHWDEAKQAYLDARLADAKEKQRKAEAARAEANLAAQARLAQEWVERSTEAAYVIEPDTEVRSYSDRFRTGYIVRKEDEGRNAWDSSPVEVQQDGRAPAIVRITSGGNMSPNKARAVAQALILAANKADERDITNGPA